MWKWLLLPLVLDFSWDRLHSARTVQDLTRAVHEYQDAFPCEECREHFDALVRNHPFPLEEVHTTEDMRIWTWLTHNMVNRRIGKEWEGFDVMYRY